MKSQKVVHFPYENFDPTPYLASIPQETILRHCDLKIEEPLSRSKSANTTKNFDIPEGCEDEEEESGTVDEDEEEDDEVLVTETKTSPARGPSTLERRKRLISTSLIKTPVLDGDLMDYHNHRLKAGYGEFDLKYSLYAVVVSGKILL